MRLHRGYLKALNKLNENLRIIAGKLAKECGGTPIQWLQAPLRDFWFNLDCITRAVEADKDLQDKKQREQELDIIPMSSTFEEWWAAKEADEREEKRLEKLRNITHE